MWWCRVQFRGSFAGLWGRLGKFNVAKRGKLCAIGGVAFSRTKNVSHMGRRFCVSKNLPLGGRWPEGPEGESLAFARNLRACMKLSPPPPAGGAPSQRGPRSFSTSCWKCAVFNTESVIFTEFLLCSAFWLPPGH